MESVSRYPRETGSNLGFSARPLSPSPPLNQTHPMWDRRPRRSPPDVLPRPNRFSSRPAFRAFSIQRITDSWCGGVSNCDRPSLMLGGTHRLARAPDSTASNLPTCWRMATPVRPACNRRATGVQAVCKRCASGATDAQSTSHYPYKDVPQGPHATSSLPCTHSRPEPPDF